MRPFRFTSTTSPQRLVAAAGSANYPASVLVRCTTGPVELVEAGKGAGTGFVLQPEQSVNVSLIGGDLWIVGVGTVQCIGVNT